MRHTAGVPNADDVRAHLSPTGVLRAVINLGNPVLAQGSPDAPRGVTVDIAREIGRRLDVPLALPCVGAAKDSLAMLRQGVVDLAFLAIEPARADEVAFTSSYLTIEAVYAVPHGSPFTAPEQVDVPGVRIGVKEGSAYDLFLTRTLRHAELVRGAEGTEVFLAEGLDAGAGIRAPVTDFVAATPGMRLIDAPVMEIRQAVALARDTPTDVVAWVEGLLDTFRHAGR